MDGVFGFASILGAAASGLMLFATSHEGVILADTRFRHLDALLTATTTKFFTNKSSSMLWNRHLLRAGDLMSDIPVDREFWRDLKRQIARKVRNPTDAEDLLHSAYIKFQRYSAQKEVLDPAAFIVKVACNLGIDSYRRQKKTVDPCEAEEIQDNSPLQDEAMAAQARLKRVNMGIERLPPKTREIFVMSRRQNLRYPEIASRLGISVSSVEKHMAKAMLFLADWTEGW